MILVIGAGGQVGTALMSAAGDAVGLGRRDLDLAHAGGDDIDRLLKTHVPQAVVNCAAYTAVDQAETEEDRARHVNGTAVGLLATACGAHRIPLVTYSTDYVFPGSSARPYTEADPVDPINAYGRSKLLGEQQALAASDLVLVIRTSWVISDTRPNFVATMLRAAAEGRRLRVVDDQWGRPTIASDLASATLSALENGVTGLLHVANEGPTTWFELAQKAVHLAGLGRDRVEACTTEEYPTPAPRPRFSVLDTRRADSLGIVLPPWTTSLPAVVNALT